MLGGHEWYELNPALLRTDNEVVSTATSIRVDEPDRGFAIAPQNAAPGEAQAQRLEIRPLERPTEQARLEPGNCRVPRVRSAGRHASQHRLRERNPSLVGMNHWLIAHR